MDIMASIHPEYCVSIFKGIKGAEIRRNTPKLTSDPARAFVYCTQKRVVLPEDFEIERGMIVGEFMFHPEYITKNTIYNDWSLLKGSSFEREFELVKMSCLQILDLRRYAKGGGLWAWVIDSYKLYTIPKALYEFEVACAEFKKLGNSELCANCKVDTCNGYIQLERPPQSWCYVRSFE